MSDIAFKVLIGNGYDDVLFKTIMLKGEKGDKGEAGGAEIDDSTISSAKTWSSNKINSEISAKPSAFSQLSDVAISNISDGQMSVYNSATGKWKNQNVDASTLKYNSTKTIKAELDAKASSLTDLDDVSITNPQNEQGVIYDATTGKWKNGDVAKFTNTASGSLVHIEDGADNIPVKSLVSQIVAVETGNGQPKSPDNPYTISGFDSGVITRCGKNWFNDTVGTHTVNANTDRIIAIGDVWLKANQTYVISCKQTPNVVSSFVRNIFVVYGNGQTVYNSAGNANTIKPMVFTPTASGIYSIRVWGHTLSVDTDYTEFQVELENTPSEYHAYNGNAYTFAFGQTVYGGYFDNKGNLVVTYEKYVPNNSVTISGQYRTSHNCWVFTISSALAKYKTNGVCMSTINEPKAFQEINTSGFALAGINKPIFSLADSDSGLNSSSTLSEIRNAFYDFIDLYSPYAVYELANPITLSITSQDIPTLLGENNIFSNCGDVKVNYYTSKSNDILEFIDSEISKKNGTNIPIEENSPDSIKTYVDDEISSTKDYIDNGLNGKADTSDFTIEDLSSSVTLNSAFDTPDYKKMYKYGNVIHLMMRAKLNSNLANNSAVVTMPSRVAPKGNDYAQNLYYGTQYATTTPLNCYFGSFDNGLHTLGAISSGQYVMIDTMWITN